VIDRPFWRERLENAWKRVPIAWLSGVRRVGKTTLAKSLDGAQYVNCDLPRQRQSLEDPEYFFANVSEDTVILDEVHKLTDPSTVLKIAADEFSHLKILATGSSTLAATQKFKDSLTGRKRNIHLTPVLISELSNFGKIALEDRLYRGGLPQRVLDDSDDPEFYSEWLDSYFARDIQELFRVSKRSEFLRLTELLIRRNGSALETTSLSKETLLTRPTVNNYLEILETTHVIRRIRPFHGGGRREILSQPKCYAFDTGFVVHNNGWKELRPSDCGSLLENLVLDELGAKFPQLPIHYWRDKQQREIDFVLPDRNGTCHCIECKWNASKFDMRNLDAFRSLYPEGGNFVVSNISISPYTRRMGPFEITFTAPSDLTKILSKFSTH
jgi:predicted AAA+ superfamily ATPase